MWQDALPGVDPEAGLLASEQLGMVEYEGELEADIKVLREMTVKSVWFWKKK